MHLQHFFRGLLRKEEVASAFLATLLECDPAFRGAFFRELFPNAAVALTDADWSVRVEADLVDVRLDSGAAVVLIENKVKAGAYQSGQLLRYYASELARVPADKSIFVAFVAPEGVGVHETDRLAAWDAFREGDSTASVSWQTLAAIAASLQPPEARRWFGESGFEEIARVIEGDSRPVYLVDDTRKVLRQVADNAFQELRDLWPVRLSRWSGRDCEQILTNRTNVTLWLDLAFDTEDEPPYSPINVREGKSLKVFLRTQFKLSSVGRKEPELMAWWRQRVRERLLEIPGLGEHQLNQQGWFGRTVETVLPADSLAGTMREAGLAVLEELSRRLGKVGFPLMVQE